MLEGPEQGLVEVEVRELRPARQHLRQNVVDEGNGLLGYVALLVTRRLDETGQTLNASAETFRFFTYLIFNHIYFMCIRGRLSRNIS